MDLRVVEGDSGPEGFSVSVGTTMFGPMKKVGAGSGTTVFDLDMVGISSFRYIRIDDDGDGVSMVANAGFDLDAVEAFENGGKPAGAQATYISPSPVKLALGVTDHAKYGHDYGAGAHPHQLVLEFANVGRDLTLSLAGFDIDYKHEVGVWLNGSRELGHLRIGPPNALNGGDIFKISAKDLEPGKNEITLFQKVPGWRWGATEIRLDTLAAVALHARTARLPELHSITANRSARSIRIGFTLNAPEAAVFSIHNMQGDLQHLSRTGILGPGMHTLDVPTGNMGPGVFFCKIHAGTFTDRKRFLILP
jgi:hypothetical protein